jgi:hypothetical protein
MSITVKEALIKKYLELKSEIKDETINKLLPELDTFDISDLILFLEYTDINDTTNLKDTVISLMHFLGQSQHLDKIDKYLPVIEKFIKFYIDLKKV